LLTIGKKWGGPKTFRPATKKGGGPPGFRRPCSNMSGFNPTLFPKSLILSPPKTYLKKCLKRKQKRCTHNNSGTSATSTCTKLSKIIEISVLSSLLCVSTEIQCSINLASKGLHTRGGMPQYLCELELTGILPECMFYFFAIWRTSNPPIIILVRIGVLSKCMFYFLDQTI
jgi:hypothetical protein